MCIPNGKYTRKIGKYSYLKKIEERGVYWFSLLAKQLYLTRRKKIEGNDVDDTFLEFSESKNKKWVCVNEVNEEHWEF